MNVIDRTLRSALISGIGASIVTAELNELTPVGLNDATRTEISSQNDAIFFERFRSYSSALTYKNKFPSKWQSVWSTDNFFCFKRYINNRAKWQHSISILSGNVWKKNSGSRRGLMTQKQCHCEVKSLRGLEHRTIRDLIRAYMKNLIYKSTDLSGNVSKLRWYLNWKMPLIWVRRSSRFRVTRAMIYLRHISFLIWL